MCTYFGRCCYSSSSKSAGASLLPLISIYINELQQKNGISMNELQQKLNISMNELQQRSNTSLKIDQNAQPNNSNKTLFYRKKYSVISSKINSSI